MNPILPIRFSIIPGFQSEMLLFLSPIPAYVPDQPSFSVKPHQILLVKYTICGGKDVSEVNTVPGTEFLVFWILQQVYTLSWGKSLRQQKNLFAGVLVDSHINHYHAMSREATLNKDIPDL